MATYPLLLLLVACAIPLGQSQQQKDCYSCRFRVFSMCWFTSAYSSSCQDDSYYCGSVRYILASTGDTVFTTFGCLPASDCNRTGQVQSTSTLRLFNYNSTCCNSNYCNGAFTVQAPHVSFLAALSGFLYYIIS